MGISLYRLGDGWLKAVENQAFLPQPRGPVKRPPLWKIASGKLLVDSHAQGRRPVSPSDYRPRGAAARHGARFRRLDPYQP
jgi:hypothetical protein